MPESSQPSRFVIVDAEVFDITGKEPPQFDVWLVPATEAAEFHWQRQYPGAALMLVEETHAEASSAWQAGRIHEDEFPFWMVPASSWTESLYREAARRWAVAVSGDPHIQLRFMRSSPLDMTGGEWAIKTREIWDTGVREPQGPGASL